MIIDDYGQKLFDLFGFSEEQIEKVAEKIVNKKVLTVSDLKMLYTLLSGDTDPSHLFRKRTGPRETIYLKRDIEIAEKNEELENIYNSPKEVKNELRKFIDEKKYGLSGEGIRAALKKGKIGLAEKKEKLRKRRERSERFRIILASRV